MNKVEPYQRPWVEIFAEQLQLSYPKTNIEFVNSSQSGADSDWAKTMASRMVGSLDPDFVIIAFGQNDFWRASPDIFETNIRAAMQIVRQTNPRVEFLLVSTMRFDPAYSVQSDYWNLVSAYDERLRSMTGPGVGLVDFTNISGAVFGAKEPEACLNDPLHPNDYLSRWYAQSLLAALHEATSEIK